MSEKVRGRQRGRDTLTLTLSRERERGLITAEGTEDLAGRACNAGRLGGEGEFLGRGRVSGMFLKGKGGDPSSLRPFDPSTLRQAQGSQAQGDGGGCCGSPFDPSTGSGEPGSGRTGVLWLTLRPFDRLRGARLRVNGGGVGAHRSTLRQAQGSQAQGERGLLREERDRAISLSQSCLMSASFFALDHPLIRRSCSSASSLVGSCSANTSFTGLL